MSKPSESSPRYRWVNTEDFEFICFNLAKKLMEFNEPIPDYSTRDKPLLESSLASPRQSYELLGSSLTEQASVLFYSLIKNHPFRNGNKRIAVMALLIFLMLNNKWLEIPPLSLYKIALLVAESDPKERDSVLKENMKLFDKYIVKLES
ncbi:MAG: type II toxin-antitoxin system death-on-curing family toxin [Actinobacteria bacterium]|nr:type II toxin-antitoxin system death-on-curing family toxin [Actinomycetota bacterium]